MNESPQFTRSNYLAEEQPRAKRGCHIVTFYEDLAGAARARKAFDFIAQKFGADRPVYATSWSFTMLGIPDLNVPVVLDAALADVIVIAAKGDRELPPRIASWMEMCIKTGENPEPVLVALHDDGLDSDGAAGPFCASIRKFASRQGVTFMCNRDVKESTGCEIPVEPFHDESRSPVRVAGMPGPLPESHRWWGIND